MENSADAVLGLRLLILDTWQDSQEGHIPSSYSILDILFVLYSNQIWSPIKSDYSGEFILSKGHASLGLYAVLSKFGFFPPSELKDFGKFSSLLGGHPDRNKCPGVFASTGSLGHGLPIAVGHCIANSILGKSNRIFVLVGDGELNEGTNWESLMIAHQFKVSNLTLIVDFNSSTNSAVSVTNLANKLESFGFETVQVNGHSHTELTKAIDADSTSSKAIIAHTVKGYGIKDLENNPAWHHARLSEDDYLKFRALLK